MVFYFIDKESRVISMFKLTSLPVKEEVILEKSMEFWGDPEPCMIHRNAVLSLLFTEIEKSMNADVYSIDRLPSCFIRYLKLPPDTIQVKVIVDKGM